MKYDLHGMRFGNLVVICRDGNDPKHKDALWRCKCDCGRTKIARSYDLRHGQTTHCGCLLSKHISAGNYKHGCSPRRLHEMWVNMKTRCTNPNYSLFSRYGGRGITVCDEWMHDFGKFREWALSNGYSSGLQIDRVNNDLGYSPSNCKFSTGMEQANNRRTNRRITAFGVTDTMANTARKYRVKYSALQFKLDRGVDAERAILSLGGDAH